MMSPAGGLAAAVGSAVCNGSFGTISRLDKVQRAQVRIKSNSWALPNCGVTFRDHAF